MRVGLWFSTPRLRDIDLFKKMEDNIHLKVAKLKLRHITKFSKNFFLPFLAYLGSRFASCAKKPKFPVKFSGANNTVMRISTPSEKMFKFHPKIDFLQ